jgi:hypothetical protein
VNNNQSREVNEMQIKIHLSGMAVVASILIILASGCASPSMEPSLSKTQSSVISIEQPPMTNYMRSQIGTPNELSPIAPAEARNVRKVGNRWMCDLNGQAMVFNDASSCWEPQTK